MSDNNTPAPSAAVETPVADTSAESSAEVLETSEEGGEEVEAPAPKAPKKEEKPSNKRKYKLKVDGNEFEEEVDLDNDEWLTQQLQLAKASQKRFREYSDLERQVHAFINDLRKDPRKVLSDPSINIDIKQLAAQVIEEELANSEKTPEQLEREKLESELTRLKEEREAEKEESRTKEFQRLQQQEFERYDMLMTKALEKSTLPKSPYIVKRMADYMLMGLQNKLDVTPDDVLPLVQQEMQNDLKDMFASMPDEVIESIVGKDVFSRVRKKSVAKAKAALPSTKAADVAKNTEEDKPKTKITVRDWLKI